MNRYRSYGELDDQPKTVGDGSFIGVDEYNASENIRPGNVQKAVNHDFTSQDANTRGGFVAYPETGDNPFAATLEQETFTATLRSVNDGVFDDGYYVMGATNVGGLDGTVIYSTDATTWTAAILPLTSFYPKAVAYGGTGTKRWVAVGNVGIYPPTGYPCSGAYQTTAFLGSVWTAAEQAFLSYSDIVWSNDKFVAVGPGGVGYSTDGQNWTQSNAINFVSVTYGNGLYVACQSEKIYYSTDAVTWTLAFDGPNVTPYRTYQFSKVRFGGGRFVVISSSTEYPFSSTPVTFAYSDTGSSWQLTSVSVSNSESWNYNALAYGNGMWVVAGAAGTKRRMLISTNGIGWNPITIPFSARDYFSAVYGNGKFVIGGQQNGSTNAGMIWNFPGANVLASGIYSDPNAIGETWIMLVGYDKVGFYANGRTSKTISLGSYTVTEQSTIVQANNYVYIFRGADQKPLYWDGNWNGTFALVPDTTLPDSFASIPNSNQATYYQNRLWVVDGKDSIAASDVLAFTDYDPLANEFNINTGNSDYVVATYPFGQNSLVAFKNKSILLLQNVEGSLSDVTVTEVTRQVGVVGINGVTSIGPDLAYVSNRNINLLTLTATNNALQHKILPLSTRIQKIMDRVNWEVGYKISLGYWNNKLYVALPLDNSLVCNAVVVYNFTTENWYGEWAFSDTLNMCIQGWQVVDYLGLQRMHAITEDGRIFVTDEGQNDISGATVAEISTQLVTRAYDTDNLNHFQRRIYLDLATNRAEFSAAAFTEGASEESTLLTDQTYSRSETWKFADSTYDLTNANNDYNRAYRKDYSTGADSVQPGTGFEPEMVQEFRLPLMTRRQGRLSWIEVTNTQGFISVMSLGYETRPGQRANLVQV
jgi:hypothetical protein